MESPDRRHPPGPAPFYGGPETPEIPGAARALARIRNTLLGIGRGLFSCGARTGRGAREGAPMSPNVTARHGHPTRPADRLDFPQNPGANSRFQGAAAPAPPCAFTPGATRESKRPHARAGVDSESPDRSLARRDARGARARPSGCGGAAGRADFPRGAAAPAISTAGALRRVNARIAGQPAPLPPATAWGRLTTPSAPTRQQKRGEPVSFCITGAFFGGRTSRETRGRRPAVERGETLTFTDIGARPAYFATFATP